jgi:hypothetical protein
VELRVDHTGHFRHIQRPVKKGLNLLCLVEGSLKGTLSWNKRTANMLPRIRLRIGCRKGGLVRWYALEVSSHNRPA